MSAHWRPTAPLQPALAAADVRVQQWCGRRAAGVPTHVECVCRCGGQTPAAVNIPAGAREHAGTAEGMPALQSSAGA